MSEQDAKRLTRLSAILVQLQTKRVITARNLAEKFGVSIRTIYRDIHALEQSGVPIFVEEGKGYSLMDGYKIPPIMFTEDEANALITVEKLVIHNKDSSLTQAYAEAISKVKAVLLNKTKDKVDLLSNRIAVSAGFDSSTKSNILAIIQSAITNFEVLDIIYHSEHKDERTHRDIEPFALYYSLQESWVLIAFCRLRQDFRMFRLDRIVSVNKKNTTFTPHKLTLQEFLKQKEKNYATPDKLLS